MNKKVKKKIMTLALAAMLTAVSVMPAKAASEDVIDTSKTASLTIHKYDITAATQAGVNVDATNDIFGRRHQSISGQ